MNIDDLINNLTKLEENIKAELPRIAEEHAGNALAEVWQQIETEGAKEGAQYSKEPMYASESIFNRKGAFKGRGKTGKTKKASGEPHRSMYLQVGYEELRQVQGLPTNVVNLEYTGRLHQNMKVLDVIQEGTKVQAIVGATNEENKKKLNGLNKKFGDFLAITHEISKVIDPIPAKRIAEIIKNTLG